jgi:PAS domain S-box-containing protein
MSPALQETLLELFEHVRDDPDSFPSVPVDEWGEGSAERQLLESFCSMAEQVHERIHQLKQTEQFVREQEELYHSAFDATHDGLFIGDLEGEIVEVNPAACEMYGYSHEEMIGLTGFQLNHPDSHPIVEELNAKLPPPPGTRPRLLALRKDGTTFYTEGQVAVFPYQGKLHRVAAVRDITAQVQAEQQLREREEQYRSVFEATTDGLTINDLEDGHVVEANPAACQMYGYTYDEMIGLPLAATIHPDSFHHVTEVLQTIPEGGHYQERLLALRKDGTTFHVDGRGTPFVYKGRPHLLGVIRDVTAQVQAEEHLRESEE